jgi:hypothetical protein
MRKVDRIEKTKYRYSHTWDGKVKKLRMRDAHSGAFGDNPEDPRSACRAFYHENRFPPLEKGGQGGFQRLSN